MATTTPDKGFSRERAALAVVLTAVAGAVDALSFTSLGRVFTANMTGNIVLLGIAAGQGLGAESWRSGIAFASFTAGLLAGYQLAHPAAPVARCMRTNVRIAFALELLIVTAFFALWLAAAGHPAGSTLLVLICLSAVAMGIQSATATRLTVTGVATTYVTGTLTSLMGSLAAAGRPPRHAMSQAAALLALGTGAVLAIVVRRLDPAIAALVPLAILATALVMAAVSKDLQ
ncbi:MAG TPA: YoaK family protein [Streptosporangiaceae bacterium]|nr:YoaK family protein [Streptosporangiaceae bacterium]